MPYAVVSTTHNPGPSQVRMLTSTKEYTGSSFTQTTGETYGGTNNRYSTSFSSSYASGATQTATWGSGTTINSFTSYSEAYICASRTYRSGSSGTSETTRPTSLYSLAVQTTTTATATATSQHTRQTLGTESYITVGTLAPYTATITFTTSRQITITDLFSATTVTRTTFRTTNDTTVAETSVHQITVTYPAEGEYLYGRTTAASSDPIYKLVDSTVTFTLARIDPAVSYITLAVTETAQTTQTATTLSPLTQTTTFAELASFPTTITRQTITSAGGFFTTTTAASVFYSTSEGPPVTIAPVVTSTTTNIFWHSGGTNLLSTRIDSFFSFSDNGRATKTITFPTVNLPTNGNTVNFGETSATVIDAITFENRPGAWSRPVISGNPGVTLLETLTHTDDGGGKLIWVLSKPFTNQSPVGSIVVTNHGAGAVAPAESMAYSNAGMGLTGIPAGYDDIRILFKTDNTVFNEGLAIQVPLSNSTRSSWFEAGASYWIATSLNSVSATRGSSTTTDTTSFVWDTVISSISTRYDFGSTHGVYSVNPATGFERGGMAYTFRDGTGLTTQRRTGFGSFAVTDQQIIMTQIPVMVKGTGQTWSRYFSGPNNERSVL